METTPQPTRPTWEHRLQAVLALLGGEPVPQVTARFGMGRSIFYKWRHRALTALQGALTDHRDLVPIYNAADVFVHPSAYEGWSMTTLEALACGTAVVAANRGGLAEAVAGHGLMLDELTPESFADAIGRVLRDDDLRRDLQSRAVERGSAIRWEQTTSQTLEVLRTVATR